MKRTLLAAAAVLSLTSLVAAQSDEKPPEEPDEQEPSETIIVYPDGKEDRGKNSGGTIVLVFTAGPIGIDAAPNVHIYRPNVELSNEEKQLFALCKQLLENIHDWSAFFENADSEIVDAFGSIDDAPFRATKFRNSIATGLNNNLQNYLDAGCNELFSDIAADAAIEVGGVAGTQMN